jgi:hypothetical protein
VIAEKIVPGMLSAPALIIAGALASAPPPHRQRKNLTFRRND